MTTFRFADIFAGIGGFRRGLEQVGGECVYTVEWDVKAREAYEADRLSHNTGRSTAEHRFRGDIRKVVDELESGSDEPPSVHLLAAGFPCQPFSLAGVVKKVSLGRPHGFDDTHQGDLIFELVRLIRHTRPPIILLENVKNLRSHARGTTWAAIRGILEGKGAPSYGMPQGYLDYNVTHAIVDAQHWVPQHRERLFIVGLHRDWFGDARFIFPARPSRDLTLSAILEEVPRQSPHRLSDALWTYLDNYARTQRERGNGFGCSVIDVRSIDASTVTRTLSARYYKDGSEILIRDYPRSNPRRLTPRECARLMGFAGFVPHRSQQAAYKQFGNAVVPPVVTWIAQEMERNGLLEIALSAPRYEGQPKRPPAGQATFSWSAPAA